MLSDVIGKRSEPPSDKVGVNFLFPRPRLYVCHYCMVSYGLTTNTMPTRFVVCAHSHLIKGTMFIKENLTRIMWF